MNEAHKSHMKQKRASPSSSMAVAMASRYLVVANHFYLHQISLDGTRTRVAVSGLELAVSVDYHFRRNSLYWVDQVRRAIMEASLDGFKRSVLLDQGLTRPRGLSVDWISNKIYWTDERGNAIGVCALDGRICKRSLITTETSFQPRGLVVDPTIRVLYWTEWSSTTARIRSASMDGSDHMTLFQANLRRPYAITVDIDNQVLYWADSDFNKLECGNVDGTGRRLLISSGLEEPFDLTLLGDMLYISDSNLGILAANKSGEPPMQTIYNTFCSSVNVFGIQAVAEERQLLAHNPCEDSNGGCSHLCLLSSNNSTGFSCACPDAMALDERGFTCSLVSQEDVSSPAESVADSCQQAGYTDCCDSGECQAGSAHCFCDTDCYIYGDCCMDIENSCTQRNNESRTGYLLVSDGLYINRLSPDGARITNLISSTDKIKSIDYDYRRNYIYWTNNINQLWQFQLNGSGLATLLSSGQLEIGGVATDWVTNKVYWTESNRIRVLDIASHLHATILNTGVGSYPKALVLDPFGRWLYWSDWGAVTRIGKASMDGSNQTVIHDTDLQQPAGLAIDYVQQVLYWTDETQDRIESSNFDGSNRRIVGSQHVFQPFAISVHGNTVYFTDILSGVNTMDSMGIANIIYDRYRLCDDPTGIKVVSFETQPAGENPCQAQNGGCSHLCLLSSTKMIGYRCACPDELNIGSDGRTCMENGTSVPLTPNPAYVHGTCEAAGYIDECCTSDTCRGTPPSCSCDSNCHVFRDCCDDVHPSCQPDIDVLEFVVVPSNVTLTIGPLSQNDSRQFLCTVRASRPTTFEWTFTNTSHFSASGDSSQHEVTNTLRSSDDSYSILSTDYSSLLTIRDIQFSDTGLYTCNATIGSRIDPITTSAFCRVEVIPSVPIVAGNRTYNADETMHLSCTVEAFPQPTITWLFRKGSSTRLLLNTSRVSISKTLSYIREGKPYVRSDLVVSDLAFPDAGGYMCTVRADGSSSMQTTIHNVTIDVGNCEQGNPPCLNGGACVYNNHGRYHCVCPGLYKGRNCLQRYEPTYGVSQPVFVNSSTAVVTPTIGTSVNLTCEPKGQLTPTIQWNKDGELIPWETQPFLYIEDVLPSDRGNYSCTRAMSQSITESNSILLNLVGVDQYSANLHCNASFILEDTIINKLFATEGVFIYAVEYSGLSSNLTLLVTLLTREMLQSRAETKNVLTSELSNVCDVDSLTRFDGCETINDTEINLGESLEIPCPCSEYLTSLPDASKQKGVRKCGGSFTNGAEFLDTNFSQCTTSVSETSHCLCRAITTAVHDPLKAMATVFNITADKDGKLNTTIDVTLLSVLIQLLTDDARENATVADGYLRLIDYYQTLDPHTLSICQTLTNSSTRILDSLEQFVSTTVHRHTENDTLSTYKNYAIVLLDITVSEFRSQRFSIDRNMRAIPNDTELWSIVVASESSSEIGSAGATFAEVIMSKEVVLDCTSHTMTNTSTLRLAYLAFFTNVLFQSSNTGYSVGSVVTAALLNCTSDSLPSPISITYNVSSEMVSNLVQCASWKDDQWTTTECETLQESSEELVRCNCYSASYFGVLLIPHPQPVMTTLQAYTYSAVTSSCVLLVLVLVSLLGLSCKLIKSTEVVVLLQLCIVLMILYALFLIGAHVTSIPVLCGVNAGLIQLFMLVFFSLLAVNTIIRCFHIFTPCELSPKRSMLFIKFAMVASWIIPIVTVAATAGAWHKKYVAISFCGVTKYPLWFGLVLPFAVLFILHITANVFLLIYTLSKREVSPQWNNSTILRSSIIVLNLMSPTFYLGFICGALMAMAYPSLEGSQWTQVLFAISSFFQGPLLFTYVLCAIEAVRKFWSNLICHKGPEMYTSIREACCRSPCGGTCNTDSMCESRRRAGDSDTIISTGTNEAYETVVLRRAKDQYAMTQNPIYDQCRYKNKRQLQVP